MGDEFKFDPVEVLTDLMAKLPGDEVSICELIHYIGTLQGKLEMLELLREIDKTE